MNILKGISESQYEDYIIVCKKINEINEFKENENSCSDNSLFNKVEEKL